MLVKYQDKAWKIPVFTRLVLTFLIIIVPIYVLGINIYNWGIRTVREEISKSMTSQVSFYLNNLETEIQRIKILQYDCLTDDNLNQLASAPQLMDDFAKVQAALRLQQRLFAIKNSSIYIYRM